VWVAHFQVLQSEILAMKGDRDTAIKLLPPAIAILRKNHGPEHDWTLQAIKALESLQAGRQAVRDAPKLPTN
jgi:hypothetical protein